MEAVDTYIPTPTRDIDKNNVINLMSTQIFELHNLTKYFNMSITFFHFFYFINGKSVDF